MDKSFRYIPSPIPVQYNAMYQALANKSGRMQYYRKEPGKGRIRINRNDFIDAYNNANIIAMRPLQSKISAFQIEFYTLD